MTPGWGTQHRGGLWAVQTRRELTWAESCLQRPRGGGPRAGRAQRCPGGTGRYRGEEGLRQRRGGAKTRVRRHCDRGEEGPRQGQGGAATGVMRDRDRGEEGPQQGLGGTSTAAGRIRSDSLQDPGFNPWVWKISWRRKWQPTPVFLPGKSH